MNEMQHCGKWFRGQQKIKGVFFSLVCGNTEFILGMKRLQKASTLEPRLMATSAIWSPRYYGHFFLLPGKTTVHFLVIKTLVNTAKFFWPIGDRINRVPL